MSRRLKIRLLGLITFVNAVIGITLGGLLYTIWPNHAPFIAALTNGTIRFRIGDTWQEQPIKGGFVTVRDDSLQVCAG